MCIRDSDNSLYRSDPRRQHQTGIITMNHDDRTDQTGSHTPGSLMYILQLIIFIRKLNAKCTCKSITEVMAGTWLQMCIRDSALGPRSSGTNFQSAPDGLISKSTGTADVPFTSWSVANAGRQCNVFWINIEEINTHFSRTKADTPSQHVSFIFINLYSLDKSQACLLYTSL